MPRLPHPLTPSLQRAPPPRPFDLLFTLGPNVTLPITALADGTASVPSSPPARNTLSPIAASTPASPTHEQPPAKPEAPLFDTNLNPSKMGDAPSVRPKLPQSKSLRYIDHDLPANISQPGSAATTPAVQPVSNPFSSPMAPGPVTPGGGKIIMPDPIASSTQVSPVGTPPNDHPLANVGSIQGTTEEFEKIKAALRESQKDVDQRLHEEKALNLPHVHAEAQDYYGGKEVWSRARTYSNAGVPGSNKRRPPTMNNDQITRNRRLSHDEITPSAPRRFLVDVEETLRIVLEQEDTSRNFQISVHDSGPKLLSLGTASSNAYRSFDIRGTYMLSNLLQELALARDFGRKRIVLDEARLAENPVDRLSRMIKNSFWNALTRRIDSEGLEIACADPKNRSQHRRSIIYVPHGEQDMIEYYEEIGRSKPQLKLEVVELPAKCDDAEYVKSLNEQPGILALAMNRKVQPDGKVKLEPVPFIVPGARFNEKYGWDSYFMALGLLVDGRLDMAMNIVEHCIFEIKYYNKVLNGNRSYYLGRSQPPFLTDLALQIYNQLDRANAAFNKAWLKRVIRAAIKEYHYYWMSPPALDVTTGLSRYRPVGRGVPPETEASHFTHILEPFAHKHGISVLEFIDKYNDMEIDEPELDEYFMHDRAVRESGHDTTYRFERVCGNLVTVDLNSLMYKYETDIAQALEHIFDGEIDLDKDFALSPFPITAEAFARPERERSTSRKQSAQEWQTRATFRKEMMDKYLWNEGKSLYFDYDMVKKRQSRYESVTSLWPLWAGCASEHQALRLVRNSLQKFEVAGGLVPGTEESRGVITLDRPNRQWDYPYAWPPHQIMAWVGLERYGFLDDSARLAYRWIYMMTLTFVDFNGIVPEKFDAVELSHLVDAEYGNQGLDFKLTNREGFGWSNASYQVGLQCLSTGMRRAVAACTPPWVYFGLPKPDFPLARRRRAERDRQAALDAESGGEIKQQVYAAPPSLETTMNSLALGEN